MRHFKLMIMILLAVCVFNSTSAMSATPRFVDLGQGALFDTTTGLYWLKNADAFGFQIRDVARASCANLQSGEHGLTDGSIAGQWRLPSIEELRNLVAAPDNYRKDSLNAAGFQNVGGSANQCYYWSDSQYTDSNGKIVLQALEFTQAFEATFYTTGQEAWSPHVWPVRDATIGFITVAPTSHSFVTVGTSNVSGNQIITLSNIGTANLSVSDMSFFGGDSAEFTLDKGDGTGGTCGDTPTIAGKGSCTVAASFTPQTDGPKSTTLRISSNALNSSTMDVVLNGNSHEPNISWWKADDNANDCVGNNNGIVSNTVDGFAPGKQGQAFSFDGSSPQWVSVPHSSSLDIYGSHTAMFWIKLNALPPAGQIYYMINKFTNGVEDKQIHVNSNGVVSYYLHGTTGSGVASTTQLTPGVWTHVAVRYSGATQDIYINGVLDASAPATEDVSDSSGLLYMGYNPDRAAAYMANPNFLLDDVAWDNRALSAEAIISFAEIPPAPFTFNALIDIPRNRTIVSNTITISGISSVTDIRIAEGEYSVSSNGGSTWSDWTDALGIVHLNDKVRVRLTSSANYNTKTTATVEIGGVQGLFEVTTASLGDPNTNGLVSWWQAENTVDDHVGGNNGAIATSVTVAENNTATASLPAGKTITSYISVFGAGSNWVNCGVCTPGEESCSVTFNTTLCTDPSPGVAKTGQVTLFYDTSFAPGKVGQAFDFSANNVQWVAVPHSSSLNILNSHTVSFWIKLDALPPEGKNFYLVNKKGNTYEDKQVSLNSNGKVLYDLSGKSGMPVLSNTALQTGVWTHVAGTYDGSSFKIYINGLLDASSTAVGNIQDSAGTLYLGNNPERVEQNGDVFFSGLLDEIKWFNQPLTAGDIFQLVYGSGVPVDTDSDGIEDSWEQVHFGDLTTADATSDYDNDGYTDLQEYQNNKAIIVDPDGIAYDPKKENAPNGTGYVGSNLTPILMLLLD